jgi:hypothetical protein
MRQFYPITQTDVDRNTRAVEKDRQKKMRVKGGTSLNGGAIKHSQIDFLGQSYREIKVNLVE